MIRYERWLAARKNAYGHPHNWVLERSWPFASSEHFGARMAWTVLDGELDYDGPFTTLCEAHHWDTYEVPRIRQRRGPRNYA